MRMLDISPPLLLQVLDRAGVTTGRVEYLHTDPRPTDQKTWNYIWLEILLGHTVLHCTENNIVAKMLFYHHVRQLNFRTDRSREECIMYLETMLLSGKI